MLQNIYIFSFYSKHHYRTKPYVKNIYISATIVEKNAEHIQHWLTKQGLTIQFTKFHFILKYFQWILKYCIWKRMISEPILFDIRLESIFLKFPNPLFIIMSIWFLKCYSNLLDFGCQALQLKLDISQGVLIIFGDQRLYHQICKGKMISNT